MKFLCYSWVSVTTINLIRSLSAIRNHPLKETGLLRKTQNYNTRSQAHGWNLTQASQTVERQTYSLLEWVGDVGGLLDGLIIIARLLILPHHSLCLGSQSLNTILSLAITSKEIK